MHAHASHQAARRGTVVRSGERGTYGRSLQQLAPSMALGFYVSEADAAQELRRALRPLPLPSNGTAPAHVVSGGQGTEQSQLGGDGSDDEFVLL